MLCPCSRTRKILFHRFPAYDRVEALPVASTWVEGESTCFHHPERAAVAACADCGVFICGLCKVNEDQTSLCLSCYANRQSSAFRSDSPVRGARRIVYDNLALSLSLLPMLFFWPTLLTAPMTLYIVVRHWNKHPCSIIPRTRIRFILAALIALLQILGWVLIAFGLFAVWEEIEW